MEWICSDAGQGNATFQSAGLVQNMRGVTGGRREGDGDAAGGYRRGAG